MAIGSRDKLKTAEGKSKRMGNCQRRKQMKGKRTGKLPEGEAGGSPLDHGAVHVTD